MSIPVRGVNVAFPYQPYEIQKVFIERIIEALQEKANALLESPTGTGKTLSLLCATRAWQDSSQPNANSPASLIIYASRTHQQLEQASRELNKTSYKGSAICLTSRETSCVNQEISKLKGREQVTSCKQAVEAKNCSYYDRVQLVTRKVSEIPDIEDTLKTGLEQRYCPYYYSRNLLTLGHGGGLVKILFSPYNYLFDVTARRSLEVPWQNAVVIIDEAHNIEDVCEEAYSFTLTRHQVLQAFVEIDNLYRKCQSNGGRLNQYDLNSEELLRIKAILKGLNETFESQDLSKIARKGSDLFAIMESQGVTFENYIIFLEKLEGCADALGNNARNLECIIRAFSRLFELGGPEKEFNVASRFANQFYRLFFEKSDQGGWKLNFWCFSAAVAFKEFEALGIRSLLLVSGTLSPLDSFATSLQVRFPIRYESPHVISNEQVWLGVIPSGVTRKKLNGSFENRENDEYKQELGRTLTALVRLIPDGVLVFFPSHGALKSCIESWKRSDIWLRLEKCKESLFVEERGVEVKNDYERVIKRGEGALLFAVCRGRASEGMDFRDQSARGVIIVGLPFPSKNEARIVHKRIYLDENKSLFGTSGQSWYTQQAHKAVNQAIGRVVRHVHDYGAVVLLDERFSHFRPLLSLWLRPCFRNFEKGMDEAVPSIASFFRKHKSVEVVIEDHPQTYPLRDSKNEKADGDKGTEVQKKIRLIPDERLASSQFVLACQASLSRNKYLEFKILLENYKKVHSDQSLRDLNTKVMEIFSSIPEAQKRRSLLNALVGFLPPHLARSLAKDIQRGLAN